MSKKRRKKQVKIELPGKVLHSNKFVKAGVVQWYGDNGLLIEAVKHGQKMPSDFQDGIKQNRVSNVSAFDELSVIVHATVAELKAFVKRVEADEKSLRKEFLKPGNVYIRHFSSDLCFVIKAK